MTTAAKQAERAAELHQVAEALHGVADELHGVKTTQQTNGTLLRAMFGVAALLVVALVVVGVLAVPIVSTARTVDHVAGPKAQAQQAASTQAFIAGFLCAQRENTSESRVMDGKPPLPLKNGCPPYDFDPNDSVLRHLTPPSATTTTAPKHKQRSTPTTAKRAPSSSTTPPTTSTTAAVHTPTTTCPTIRVGSTCVTIR